MSAYDQHLNELLGHFKDIEPDEKKLKDKIEVVLCQAYRLKNCSNSSPFVPATRGEWNMLYFNPDLLDKKFELSRDNVYIPILASLTVNAEAAEEERQLGEFRELELEIQLAEAKATAKNKEVDKKIDDYRNKISENNIKLNELNEKIKILNELNEENSSFNDDIKKLETPYNDILEETVNFYNEIKNLLNEYLLYETNNNIKILDKIDKIQKNKYAETLKEKIIAKLKQSKIESKKAIDNLDAKIAEYQEEEEEEEG